MKLRPLLLVFLLVGFARAEPVPVVWHAWSPEIFAQAKRENKFVLLDLEAVWCHWCHVMEATTYREPAVTALLGARYLCVRADQDARPDLSNRYEDYGWPATVIFAPDGGELVKRQGYIKPGEMAALLQAVMDDPTPGPSVRTEREPAAASATALGDARRTALLTTWRDRYDREHGGWGFSHKFLDWDNVELALRLASHGDTEAATFATETLRQQLKLLDPVWGGVYQYSAGGDWDEPHFEKLGQFQAENLRLYALAFAQLGEPRWREAAEKIHGYIRTFLTDAAGAFYVSQDADLVPGEHSADYFALSDTARRARGVPRVDRHLYARENGWMISALCALSAATGEAAPRAEAERAARWVLAHRALDGGGFRHDARDGAGPFLGDTLAMGRAFLALHQLTQEREWLVRAEEAAAFIGQNFRRATMPGFASSATTAETFPAPRPQFDENANLARFATALAAATGRAEHRELAATALRWLLASENLDARGPYLGGALLAEEEARNDPLHVTIIGAKSDPVAHAMLVAALHAPTAHKLVEWWDRREGAAPRGEDIFPELPRAAAFLCANGACSAPLATAEALAARLAKVK